MGSIGKENRSNVVSLATCRSDAAACIPSPAALDAEAARRIRRLGYDDWLRCERRTGVSIPALIRYRRMQIEFAAAALKRLDPLPDNFQADHFWPA